MKQLKIKCVSILLCIVASSTSDLWAMKRSPRSTNQNAAVSSLANRLKDCERKKAKGSHVCDICTKLSFAQFKKDAQTENWQI